MIAIRDRSARLIWRWRRPTCPRLRRPADAGAAGTRTGTVPDDIPALKALMARDAELAAAKNGLVVSSLTIEKLKAPVAFEAVCIAASAETPSLQAAAAILVRV